MYTCILFSRVDVLDHVEDALGLPNVGVGDDVVLEVDEAKSKKENKKCENKQKMSVARVC